MKTYLKIKGLSLAGEARIIKRLEKSRQTHPKLAASLHMHRTHEVRSEARSTHLALGFLRGVPYKAMELPLRPLNEGHKRSLNMTRTAPDWKRVEQLVNKYGQQYFEGAQDLTGKFTEWKSAK
jgi:hypothetical protein